MQQNKQTSIFPSPSLRGIVRTTLKYYILHIKKHDKLASVRRIPTGQLHHARSFIFEEPGPRYTHSKAIFGEINHVSLHRSKNTHFFFERLLAVCVHSPSYLCVAACYLIFAFCFHSA
jgi:hypothetical protein